MSDTVESLRRQIDGARDLRSVVRTMKALAAANISQYEKAVQSLADYYRTVELGLVACLRESGAGEPASRRPTPPDGIMGAVVFGSDQGLVGQFNDRLARFTVKELSAYRGSKTVWAVGERVHACLQEENLLPVGPRVVPNSVIGITQLVARVLLDLETARERDGMEEVVLFHNRPKAAATYEPVLQRLLPLDVRWRQDLETVRWPTSMVAQVMDSAEGTFPVLVREYLFVSLFRACAESLSSENASRLAAMQRAGKNIDDLQRDLGRTFNRLRQSSIDEELFDLVSGFEALSQDGRTVVKGVGDDY